MSKPKKGAVRGAVSQELGAKADADLVANAKIEVHEGNVLTVSIPGMTLDGMSNTRGNVYVRHRREVTVRDTVYATLRRPSAKDALDKIRAEFDAGSALCTRLILTRPRLLDRDNVVVSLKYAVDAIARVTGVDDSNPRMELQYVHSKPTPEFGAGLHIILYTDDILPPRSVARLTVEVHC